ncbi:hypothetical protein HDU93_005810, partial [Gonapodya sp. JEL0774]
HFNQALVMLVFYSSTTGVHGSLMWLYTGMAVRMSFELDLNVEPNQLSNRLPLATLEPTSSSSAEAARQWTWAEKESRRRAWWAVYLIDRMSSISASRSAMIRDHECHTLLPCSQGIWEGFADIDESTRQVTTSVTVGEVLRRLEESFFVTNRMADATIPTNENDTLTMLGRNMPPGMNQISDLFNNESINPSVDVTM